MNRKDAKAAKENKKIEKKIQIACLCRQPLELAITGTP